MTGGRRITVYGQQEVVKDLIGARLETGRPLLFEVSDVAVDGFRVRIAHDRFEHEGEEIDLRCDFIAGCDGSHGVCREHPRRALTIFEREYPFAWLGILAAAPPSDELIYAYHERGFALHSMRSPTVTRLLPSGSAGREPRRVAGRADLGRARAAPGARRWALNTGEIVEKGVTGMRSFVVEPMQHGRMFLAGDSAHIVPPTSAKGLNLAVADVRVLAEGLAAWFEKGDRLALDGYSAEVLRRV